MQQTIPQGPFLWCDGKPLFYHSCLFTSLLFPLFWFINLSPTVHGEKERAGNSGGLYNLAIYLPTLLSEVILGH